MLLPIDIFSHAVNVWLMKKRIFVKPNCFLIVLFKISLYENCLNITPSDGSKIASIRSVQTPVLVLGDGIAKKRSIRYFSKIFHICIIILNVFTSNNLVVLFRGRSRRLNLEYQIVLYYTRIQSNNKGSNFNQLSHLIGKGRF